MGQSYEKPTLFLSYQDKKPVTSLIHSVSLETLRADLPPCRTPHISGRWRDPVKENAGGALLTLIISAAETPEINFPGNRQKKTHFIKVNLLSYFSALAAAP